MKKLKILLYVIALLTLGFFVPKTIRGFLVKNESAHVKTDHFMITYHGIYEGEAEDVGKTLEDKYARIRTELNDPDHGVISVFIHPTHKDFMKATGISSGTVTGTSRGPLEFHVLWTTWYNSIFPDNPRSTAVHEFTHCVQLNILISKEKSALTSGDTQNFDKAFEKKFLEKYPQWFWEAICTYEANEINALSVKYAMRSKPDLNKLNESNQIYLVGYTLIEYIVETWGKDKLPELITSYVDLERVLNVTEAEFEAGWYKFVSERY